MFSIGRSSSNGHSASSLQRSFTIYGFRTDANSRESVYMALIALLENDVYVTAACKRLAETLGDQNASSRIVACFEDITERTKLVSFSDAISEWIPHDEAMLIAAGDEAGDLLKGIREALLLLQNNREIMNALMSTLSGPILLLTFLYGVIMIISMVLMPTILDVVPVDEWPPLAKPFYYFSKFVQDQYISMTILLLFLVALAFGTLNMVTGRFRKVLDYFPPWSVHKRISAITFLNSLSAIMSQNITAYNSLEMIRKHVSPFMRSHIDKMTSEMGISGDPGKAITSSKLFTPDVAALIICLASEGSFSDRIVYIARREMKQIFKWTQTVSRTINIITMLIIGAVLVWAIGSIYYVVFSMYFTLQSSTGY